MVLFIVAMGSALSAITFSAINVALPSIAAEFPSSALLVSWVPTSFVLTNAILILPFGRLADAIGRKRVYLTGIMTFCVTSFLVTLSTSMEWIIFFRVLQAVGTAMLQACGMAIVTGVFPPRIRGLAIGMAASSLYVGMSIGPLVGGLLTESYGWRSVFYSQIPFSVLLVGLIVGRFKGEWRADNRTEFDWIGFALLATTLTSLIVGVSRIPERSSIALIGIAIVSGIVFVAAQLRFEHPLLPLKAIGANKVFRESALTQMSMYAGVYPMVFLLSLYLQYLLGLSPSEAGLMLVIQAVVMAVTAPITGRLSDGFMPQKIAAVGSIVAGIGYFSLCWLDYDTPLIRISASLSLVGLGLGLFTIPNYNAALSAVPAERLSTASAVMSLARHIGNIIGVGVTLTLIAIFLGVNEINPSTYDQFLVTVRGAFAFSCAVTFLSAWLTVDIWRKRVL